MISFEEARKIFLETNLPKRKEAIPLLDSRGRVLAETLEAPWDFPRFTNSAMDGFAFQQSEELETGSQLRCIGESAAGKVFKGELKEGECIRISTGAVLPDCCDTVIPREKVEDQGEVIVLNEVPRKGFAVRQKGEDVQQGSELVRKGSVIGPAEIGFLSMYNIPTISVWSKPRVSVLTSGEELRLLGESLEESQIIGSNLYSTCAALEQWGCEVKNFGISADDPDAFQELLLEAVQWGDLIISSAGVSVGDHDVVPLVTERVGANRKFWKVSVRPGKPTLFCVLNNKPYLALPGNPVAVMVGLELFVRPLLRKYFEFDLVIPKLESLQLAEDLKPDLNRHFFAVGEMIHDQSGLAVKGLPHQSSGNLSNMVRGDCLLSLKPNTEALKKGDLVQVIRLTGAL